MACYIIIKPEYLMENVTPPRSSKTGWENLVILFRESDSQQEHRVDLLHSLSQIRD